MTALLAILLYLQIIVSPGTYTDCQIEKFEAENHQSVVDIINDEPTYNYVQVNFRTQAEEIMIIDETCD